MSKEKSRFIRGIYVSPGAVVKDPAYAQMLVEKADVNLFILRTGFNPNRPDPDLEGAVKITRQMGIRCWFLVGTWWGHGVKYTDDIMTTIADTAAFPKTPAHEAQWKVRVPGGPADEEIKSALRRFCEDYEPDGICLTHARFRHPAWIPGLFESGPGRLMELMEQSNISGCLLKNSVQKILGSLARMSPKDLVLLTVRNDPVGLLDELAGSTVPGDWFKMRCRLIHESIQEFRSVVKEAGKGGILFGQNAYSPIAANLCGQDYATMKDCVDFVQPLLGYTEWHVYQPVAAWARLFKTYIHGLGEKESIQAAARLFKLINFPGVQSFNELLESGEGAAETIEAVVAIELELCRALDTEGLRIMPVLRGHGWPEGLTSRLSQRLAEMRYTAAVYQGVDALTGIQPLDGWD